MTNLSSLVAIAISASRLLRFHVASLAHPRWRQRPRMPFPLNRPIYCSCPVTIPSCYCTSFASALSTSSLWSLNVGKQKPHTNRCGVYVRIRDNVVPRHCGSSVSPNLPCSRLSRYEPWSGRCSPGTFAPGRVSRLALLSLSVLFNIIPILRATCPGLAQDQV